MRDLSHLLHPAVLDDLGLVAALESHVAEFRRRHRIAVAFAHDAVDARQPVETGRTVYRIVQEALTNIARHAHATEAHVRLNVDAGVLRIAIDDNGVGFNAVDVERPGRRRGLGLLSIRERATQLRGTVRIETCVIRRSPPVRRVAGRDSRWFARPHTRGAARGRRPVRHSE